jgi:hypothetical protein
MLRPNEPVHFRRSDDAFAFEMVDTETGEPVTVRVSAEKMRKLRQRPDIDWKAVFLANRRRLEREAADLHRDGEARPLVC